MNFTDTIVAISTAPGRGGIGIVRLSGPEARSIAAPLLRLTHELAPNRALFAELIDPASQQKMDEAVVTFFAAPHSYTTEDIVEISAHGAPVILRHIVEQCLARGARLAEPGEFTQRAFLNARLDLTQAEAVRDLIDSQTLFQAKVAAQQLGGSLANSVRPVKELLVSLIATLEAGIDFAEDDVSVLADAAILARLAQVQVPLQALAQSFTLGRIIHEGISLAIVGRPNVGKSSLFNLLAERERAIVTAAPGTTRDLVTETVAIGGISVRLTDTAGLRKSRDEAEQLGIQKSYEALAEADVVLIVLDATQPPTDFERELISRASGRPHIVVDNKCDLVAEGSVQGTAEPAQGPGGQAPMKPAQAIRTSARTGEGLSALRAAILHQIQADAPAAETGMLTNIRHKTLVESSLKGLEAAETAVKHRVPHEMLLMDLYSTLRPLDELTGATTADDILNLIFSTFCIGK